ncbi:MAG: rhodanese-like domain-containing protein [Nitrospiraceae bacterium]
MRYPIILGMAVLGVLLFLWERHRHAPTHVSDTAYDLLLSTLLSHSVPEVSVDQIQSGQYHVLDARVYREFEVSHISGATWVGYDDFDLARLAEIERQTPVAVYCSVGYRSERITERLLRKDTPMWSMPTAASSNGSTQGTLS